MFGLEHSTLGTTMAAFKELKSCLCSPRKSSLRKKKKTSRGSDFISMLGSFSTHPPKTTNNNLTSCCFCKACLVFGEVERQDIGLQG